MNHALAIEKGRVVARDIGGTDPERMAAPKVEEYVQEVFKGTKVKVEVMKGQQFFETEYPCLAAVNRCASTVPRHDGRLIWLTYEGEGAVKKTVYLVGKGITYDTGSSIPVPQLVPFPIPVSTFSAGFPFNGGFNLGGVPPVGFPTAGVPVGAQQNCVGSNCNQNNVGGGGFRLGGFPSVSFPTAGTPVVTQQNCVGSNCNQNNLGKKKREILDMVDELTKEALDSEVDDQSSEREKGEADPQIQNCAFSNCNQINFGRRKREVIAALLEELL